MQEKEMWDEPFEIRATSDIVFQYIFSSKGSEECLLPFLNAIQGSVGKPLAKSVEIQNPFSLKKFLTDKKSILDVKAMDEQQRTYDVEIQTCSEAAFRNRILFYWSRLYAAALPEGKDYTELQPVISIVLTRFALFHDELPDLHNVFSIAAEKNPQVIFSPNLQIHTLELTDKKWQRLLAERFPTVSESGRLQNWLDFLLNANRRTEDEMNEKVLTTPGLEAAYRKFQEVAADDELREAAFAQEKARRDEMSRMNYARSTAIAEGRAQGIAEGIAEGIAQGIAQGITQGKVQGRSEGMAKGLLRMLNARFRNQLTIEQKEKVLAITDEELMNQLFDDAALGVPLEEIVKKINL